MGVVVSYFGAGYAKSTEPDPATGLSPREKSMVTSSWAIIRKDITKNGVELFMIFFKDFPDYQKYFPFAEVPYDQLRDNKKLQAHACNVMYALTAVIDNLDDAEVLVNLLTKSGESHGRKTIPEKSYSDLKATVLKLLAGALGSKLTKEVLEAWDKTLTVAFNIITDSFRKQREDRIEQ